MKMRMPLAGIALAVLSLVSVAVPAAPPAGRDIPELHWEQRSDWLNVTTGVTPAAKGDGIADDTAALQAALDTMQHGSTIFLPPGSYRITKTLVMKSTKSGRLLGTALIGCGRATRIMWDGPADPTAAMLWVKTGAAHTARYIGISWDGKGRAGFGIDHRSDSFETVVVHRHEAFRNFTDTGIRVGKGVYQSAEMLLKNCLFEACGQGLAFLNFNDYNNTVDGCEFRRCGTGLVDMHGNCYVRNSHFAGNTVCDLRIHSEHGSSIRRCTSIGSRLFLHFTAFVAPITVQQCHVSQWTSPDGPVLFGGDLAPVIMFDSTFSEPPNATPPLAIPSGPLVVSGNTVEGGGALLKGQRASVVEIPAGDVTAAALPAGHSFLKDTVAIPGKVFDAKRDFGAFGDGKADDTAAIQRAIDAACAHGKGAIAYLPRGEYLVSKTIRITGADYYVGGSGSRTVLRWKGEERGVVLHVQDPDHVTLEQLTIGSTTNDTDVLQTGSGTPSFMVYDGIYVYGMYQKNPWKGGLHLAGLPKGSTVLIRELTGNMRFTNSAQARILVNTSYYGNVILEGKDKRRDGFLGFLSRFTGEKPCTLYVKDNQNLVMSDYYVESAEQHAYLEGANDDPPGRIVIQGAKLHCTGYPLSIVPLAINNYAGTIMIGHLQFNNEPKPSLISWSGQRPCDLLMVGVEWYGTTPAIRRVPDADMAKTPLQAFAIGCEVKSWNKETDKPVTQKFQEIFHAVQPDTLRKVAQGLDELRRLGQLDLELNHPLAGNSATPAGKE